MPGVAVGDLIGHLAMEVGEGVEVEEGQLGQRAAGQALAGLLRRDAAGRELAAVLTQREIEIVRMVAGGLRNKEIARRLSIGEGTVKTHLHNIFEKLEVGSRLELTLLAQRKGLT
jgi:DNA-binding NarL/FixJ family response regulator